MRNAEKNVGIAKSGRIHRAAAVPWVSCGKGAMDAKRRTQWTVIVMGEWGSCRDRSQDVTLWMGSTLVFKMGLKTGRGKTTNKVSHRMDEQNDNRTNKQLLMNGGVNHGGDHTPYRNLTPSIPLHMVRPCPQLLIPTTSVCVPLFPNPGSRNIK